MKITKLVTAVASSVGMLAGLMLTAGAASAATTCHTVTHISYTHTTYREVREHGRWVKVKVHHKADRKSVV